MMLLNEPSIEVVAEASDGVEVLRKLQLYVIDVLLLDIQLPEMTGLEVAAEVRKLHGEVKILVVSMYNERAFIERMHKLGASGYILKSAARDELISGIQKIAAGGVYFSPDVTAIVLGGMADRSRRAAAYDRITKRELEVLTLIAKEFSNNAIAESLHLSVQTVSTHRKNLLKKLAVKNTAGLVRWAMDNNVLE